MCIYSENSTVSSNITKCIRLTQSPYYPARNVSQSSLFSEADFSGQSGLEAEK